MTSSGQACVGGLMPAYTPAALKPAGAVMPPSIVWILVSVLVAALDMQVSAWAGSPASTSRSITIANCSHRLNSGQLRQSADDLFRQPGVRNDRKAHVREVRRLMGEDTQVVEARALRARRAARRRCGGRGPRRGASR